MENRAETQRKKLMNGFLVPALAHKHYTDMFAIIVRSNKSMVALNEDFIEEQLCRGESANYFKVYLTRIRENFCLF